MTTKNEYANRSKISEKKAREIITLFSFGLDDSQITKISGSQIVEEPHYKRNPRQDIKNTKSIMRSDDWRGRKGLVDLGYKKHFRVRHEQNKFVRRESHINGIESFWGFSKVRLARFCGVYKSIFILHLKECEFRFNHREQNLYKLLLKILGLTSNLV